VKRWHWIPVFLLVFSALHAKDWPQFGGPNRNFIVDSAPLVNAWSENGPILLWERELGEGNSGIALKNGVLFTTYRKWVGENKTADKELVIAIDATTGKTIWEFEYEAPLQKNQDSYFTTGPNITPFVHAENIYTIGYTGKMFCLNQKGGEVKWFFNFLEDFGADPIRFGHSGSPILVDGKLIAPVLGDNSAIVAFEPHTGKILWKTGDFTKGHGSPVLIEFMGVQQLLQADRDGLVSIDLNGNILWRYTYPKADQHNIAMPFWLQGNHILVSGHGPNGSLLLKLSKDENSYNLTKVWSNRKMMVRHGNAVHFDNMIVGGSKILFGFDWATGKVHWRQRNFAQAKILRADSKAVILDEKGILSIARPDEDGLEVLAQHKILDGRTWAMPTLAGSIYYARDRKVLRAFELGQAAY